MQQRTIDRSYGRRPAGNARRTLSALAAAAALVLSSVVAADELKPFEASYAWIWHGMTVAVTTLKLEKSGADTWTYTSRSEPRGIGKGTLAASQDGERAKGNRYRSSAPELQGR